VAKYERRGWESEREGLRGGNEGGMWAKKRRKGLEVEGGERRRESEEKWRGARIAVIGKKLRGSEAVFQRNEDRWNVFI
jgi:hypothetical protein